MITATSELLKKRHPDDITRAELARAAHIAPGLVRYYFGGMANLLTEGMIRIFEEVRAQRAGPAADAPLREQLRTRITSLIEALETHPYMHELLMRPMLDVEPSQAARMEALRRDYTLHSFETLKTIMSQAQRRGETVPTDLRMLYVMIVGMSEFAASCPQYFELMDISIGTHHQTVVHYADFLADLMLDGLRPRLDTDASPATPPRPATSSASRRRVQRRRTAVKDNGA